MQDMLPHVQYFYDRGGRYLIKVNGKPISEDTFRRRYFYPTLDRLSIKRTGEDGKNVLTPHRTHHTFVASAIKGGIAPEALSKIAGYSKYDVAVDKYADDLDVGYLKEELEKAGK